MLAPFKKYSGCGNDFIIFDNQSSFFPTNDSSLIARLCERKRGIGADGLILLEPSNRAPFGMRHFNSDGKEASMCGNGIRCLFDFICETQLPLSSTKIEVNGQIFSASRIGSAVQVDMPNPKNIKWNLEIEGFSGLFHYLDTSVPHLVYFIDDLDSAPLETWGPKLRNHPLFAPSGVNVNFASSKEQTLRMRTFERGVEAETLACGTGATAVALASCHLLKQKCPIEVEQQSGEILTISFEINQNSFQNVQMKGAATPIFAGYIEI